MLAIVAAIPVLVCLYGVYWIGAFAFRIHERSSGFDLLMQVGLGLLALVPALLLISFLTEVSAWFGHPISGWAGLGLVLLFLAHPLALAARDVQQSLAAAKLSGFVAHFRPIATMSSTRKKFTGSLCLIISLACLTQLDLTVFRERGEGVITSRIPFQARWGFQKSDVIITFADKQGTKFSFRDTTGYTPGTAGSRIAVFYDPTKPARRPLPDLHGWQHADNLRLLLVMIVFGRLAIAGLAPDRAPRRSPSTPPPLVRPTSLPKPRTTKGKKSARQLSRILETVRGELRQVIPVLGYRCDQLFYAGAYRIAPHHVFFGIGVRTDAERDLMNSDRALETALHELLRARGYPDEAISRIGFRAESQETVDRDWGGEWHRVWQ